MPSKLYDYCQYHQLCWECWGNILSLHRNVNKEEHNKNYPQKCWLCVDGFPLFGLSLACFPLSRRNRVLCDGFENCKCSFATPPFLTSYNSPFSFPSQVLTAMLAVCARLLLLLPLVCCVPSPSRPPSRLCRRCCDHSEPPAATAQYQMPEVRTVINMTILKGTPELRLASECCWLEDPVRSFCFFIPQFVLSVLAGWKSALFTRVSFQILVHEANLMLVVARSFTEKKRKNILEYLCYHLLLSSLVSLIRSLLLAFSQMAVCLARLLFNQKSNHEYCNGTVALKCSRAFAFKWSRDKEAKPSLIRCSTDKKNLELLENKKTTSVQGGFFERRRLPK